MEQTREYLVSCIDEAIDAFKFEGSFVEVYAYGNGHINDTFKLIFNQQMYILQRINTQTFKDPQGLVDNIARVTDHIRTQIEREHGDVKREVLTLIERKDGAGYLFTDSIGSSWRAYLFIDQATCFDLVEKPEHFYESGRAFGAFQANLRDFDAATLSITIPDFHNTPKRLIALEDAIAKDAVERVKTIPDEISFVQERSAFTTTFMDAYEKGDLPLKVTHNDTKLNNVMLDDATGKALCVIDLDTVMPGFSLDDFGDSIRFGASTALEDEQDLSKVMIDLDLFDIYIKGFLEGAKGSLTDCEISLFPEAAKMLTLECGIRFLTDYLQGDTYFKTKYPEHNLVRARTQFKLVQDMESKWDEMRAIVASYQK